MSSIPYDGPPSQAGIVSEPMAADLGGDPGALQLLAWWHRERERAHAMPRRRALDPTEVFSLLGAINLIDIEPDGRLRLRLYGERIRATDGHEQPMQYLDQITPRIYRDKVLADYAAMIATAAPSGFGVHLIGVAGETAAYRRLLLPLADDRGAFTNILVFNPDAMDMRCQRMVQRLLERWRRAEATVADWRR